MRIAIVGSGISGLVAAYLLNRQHEITVFEAADYVGGHTNTITAHLGDGDYQVDTGFIVFNHRTYPNFTRLLAQLGVKTQRSAMSFSVKCERTGLEYGGASLDALFAQRKNLVRPAHWRMLGDILAFYRHAPALIRQPGNELTVGEYLKRERLSPGFVEQFLLPLGASIWSCPFDRFYEFPMRFLVRFMENHGMLTVFDHPMWRVIRGGSARYVEPLIQGFRSCIRLRTPVAGIRRFGNHVAVVAADGRAEEFDHVVLACHSDQALAMLEDPSPLEREVLGAFPYQTNDVVVHTDESVLPAARQTWSSWNYHIPATGQAAATLTYNMNILQSLDAPKVACVTVNDDGRIDPRTVLRRIRYHHPVFTLQAPRYQAMHDQLINANRTSYCGAYWGFGFHEDGVKSALAVGRAFGLSLTPRA